MFVWISLLVVTNIVGGEVVSCTATSHEVHAPRKGGGSTFLSPLASFGEQVRGEPLSKLKSFNWGML